MAVKLSPRVQVSGIHPNSSQCRTLPPALVAIAFAVLMVGASGFIAADEPIAPSPGAGSPPDKVSGDRDASLGTGTVNDIPAPPPIPRMVHSIAIPGDPYGVAELTIPLAQKTSWRPDQPIVILAGQERLLFPSYTVRPSGEDEELVVRFLFQGRDGFAVDVESATEALVKGHAVNVFEDGTGHQSLLKEWWHSYTRQLVNGASPELSEIGAEVTAILARQLNLIAPVSDGRELQSSDLERQFERSIGMLFGFESVRLAMMKDSWFDAEAGAAAVHPLPSPLQVRGVTIPSAAVFGKIDAEALAAYVPKEYFYLRTQSLENYLWLRGFLMGWGGDLDEMVATPAVDQRIRERIEQQLCLDPSLARKVSLDDAIEDFALIGSDTNFAEGAGVGVLMLAKKSARVRAILDHLRATGAEIHGAAPQTVKIAGKTVSLYSTPDNTIRSFYVSRGECHLVTNSRRLVERFLECEQWGNLASLAEFRYARSKIPHSQDVTSFLYLSDPFFRAMTSPATRILASRRRRAASEIRQLGLAKLMASAQGLTANSIADLQQHRLLAPEFGKRADRSSAIWTADGSLTDSLRGKLGTFLPIADMYILGVTAGEVSAYQDFTQRYLREWQAMDPVLVAMRRQPTTDPHDERVDLEIMVTPYAREAYGFLARHLAPASKQRVHPPSEDVLTLTTQLHGESKYDVCAGLRDMAIPFRIEKGCLIKEGPFQKQTFAKRRSYAAVTPAGYSGLRLLGELTKSLQSKQSTEASRPPERTPATQPTLMPWVEAISASIFIPGEWRRLAILATLDALPHMNNVEIALQTQTVDGWTILAYDADLRREAVRGLEVDSSGVQSQIQFQVRNVNESKVGPYLHAYSWETGRRVSAENAAWLSHFAQTTKQDLVEARGRVEQLVGGELKCPLGGKYEIRHEGGASRLVSTAWGCASRFDETAVPPGYRLPFLAWLRGLKLDFELSSTTLTSHIELHVDPTVVGAVIREDHLDSPTKPSSLEVIDAVEREQIYQDLRTASRRLNRALDRLDPSGAWTIYLQIPLETPKTDDDWRRLRAIADRFQLVASDRRYELITKALGFTDTHARCKELARTLSAPPAR